MCDLRKLRIQTKLLLFTLQALFCCILTLDSSEANPPPLGVLNHRRDERPIPKFKYSYTVRGTEGGQHGHQVYRDGSYTQGKYFVRLNGGSGQNVEYYTDHLGYHPKVIYMNHMGSSSSGARIAFGRAANNFETSTTNYMTTETKLENQTTLETINVTPGTETNTFHTTETILQSTSSNTDTEQSSKLIDGEKQNQDITTPTPNEDIRNNVFNSPAIDAIGPILLTPPSEDPYLQPEINEITNSFVSNIVSMLPGIIATRTKLLKPIIVTDNAAATSKREISDNSTNITDSTSDQTVESAQPEEYHEIPDEQVIINDDNTTVVDDEETKTVPTHTEVEYKKPQVDVVIEPQTLEEQAVITTTVDIAKSLPLAVNFIPETDNHLSDISQSLNVPVNFVPQPQVILPQPSVMLPPQINPEHPVMELLPQAVLKPDAIPQPYLLPNTEFHYIPIPVLQHQPNIIPLRYLNENKTTFESAENPYSDQIRNSDQIIDTGPKSEYTFVKSIEDSPNPSYKTIDLPRKPYKPHVQVDIRRPGPYTINVPAAHLLPYVKQHFIQPHYPPQKLQPNAMPKSHSNGYHLKTIPKEKRAPQKAPFKPSHPVWDSVYPPSHMYYVPLYVVDKVPGERNPKDSFSRRNHHLRRLYIEYGGFKPPLIPSTLIESEDSAQEKRDVPKEGGES